MKLPFMRFTVRRMMFMATIFVAIFGCFTPVVMPLNIAIDPGNAPVENLKARNAACKTRQCESLANLCFDAGDFNRAPDDKAVLANLRALDKAIKTVGREKLAVIHPMRLVLILIPPTLAHLEVDIQIVERAADTAWRRAGGRTYSDET